MVSASNRELVLPRCLTVFLPIGICRSRVPTHSLLDKTARDLIRPFKKPSFRERGKWKRYNRATSRALVSVVLLGWFSTSALAEAARTTLPVPDLTLREEILESATVGFSYGVDEIGAAAFPGTLTDPWIGNVDSATASLASTISYRESTGGNSLEHPFTLRTEFQPNSILVGGDLIASKYPGGVAIETKETPQLLHVPGTRGRELLIVVPVSDKPKIHRSIGLCIHQRDLDRGTYRSRGKEAPPLDTFAPKASGAQFSGSASGSGAISVGLDPARALVFFLTNEFVSPSEPESDESLKRYPSARLSYHPKESPKIFPFDEVVEGVLETHVLLHSGPGYVRENVFQAALRISRFPFSPLKQTFNSRYGFLRRPGEQSCILLEHITSLRTHYERRELTESSE